MTTAPNARIHVGAAYYYEYQDPSTRDLERDMRLMVEAGFDTIRVGESVWSTWEPRDGEFDLDWLQPVLDAAHSHGIQVILGTPTYAVPMWLATAYPEIVGDTATGVAGHWGARQEVDITNPTFRRYAERIIRKMVERYANHPAIVGYQVDNEPGFRLLYNRGVFEGFVESLKARYGTVEALNEEWGLVYWSHRLSTWEDLWVPDGNFQPQYDLAWRRYQAQIVTDYIAWQAALVRESDPSHPERYITTCISVDQVGVEDVEISSALTVTSGNAYFEMQDALTHPSSLPMSPGWIVQGVWAVSQLADLMYSSRQEEFLVTETNAGSIGHSAINSIAYSGQWRQAAWLLVSRGARMLEYWNWNTLTYGTETYWGGVLPHSGRPGRAYRELSQVGHEMASAGRAFLGATPEADVAMLYDSDSKWALSFPAQGPIPLPNGMGDPDSYRQVLLPFYRGAFDAGLQVNTVRPSQLFGTRERGHYEDPAAFAARRPVLLIPGFYAAFDGDADWLRRYVQAGGHLVLGPRSLYADGEGRARRDIQPAGIAAEAGTWYEEFTNLAVPVALVASGGLDLPEGASGTRWAELLIADGAEVLATWDHPEWGRHPVITTRQEGTGRITIVATVPDQATARAVMAWAVPSPLASSWGEAESVRAATSVAADGSRLVVLHNWSAVPATAVAPWTIESLADGASVPAGGEIALGAWDVQVFRVRS